jgi:replicative DNA helicase
MVSDSAVAGQVGALARSSPVGSSRAKPTDRNLVRRAGNSTSEIELPNHDAAGIKLIGIVMLTEINGDVTNRNLAFQLVHPDDFVDPDLGELWRALKALHSRELALTPDRVLPAVRPKVPGAAAILYEALSGVDRAITTVDAEFYAKEVATASHDRRVRLAVHDAQRGLSSKRSACDVLSRLKTSISAISSDFDARQQLDVEMFDRFEASILNREKPKLFECASYASRLREIQVGEGLVTLVGAPPAAGKTALISQLLFDALQAPGQEHLKGLFANVEMSPQAILTRQLARLSGIGHAWLLHRDFEEAALPRLRDAMDELRQLMPRIEFMKPPFTLERLAERSAASGVNIVVLDYAQRFDFADRSNDSRAQCNAVMDVCRRIADQGRAVIVVSAVNRAGYAKDTSGLASFRESSELEYGADSAWLLVQEAEGTSFLTLKCVKNRHGQLADIPLDFDGSRQFFSVRTPSEEWPGE